VASDLPLASAAGSPAATAAPTFGGNSLAAKDATARPAVVPGTHVKPVGGSYGTQSSQAPDLPSSLSDKSDS